MATSSLAVILNGVQKSASSFPKSLKLIDTLLAGAANNNEDGGGISALAQQLIDAVDRILVVAKNDSVVDRLMGFICLVCARPRGGTLAGPLLSHLARNRLDAKDKVVRLQACKLTAALLQNMPADAEFEDSVFDALISGLLARTRDSKPPVRAAAARALERLQAEDGDDDGGSDPVTSQLAWLVMHDTSPDVRAAALSSLALNAQTLVLLLDHTRDTSTDVRVAAFKKLTDLVDSRLLTSAARTGLLRLGLSDSSAEVVKQATFMLLRWLAAAGAEEGVGPGGFVAAAAEEGEGQEGEQGAAAAPASSNSNVPKVGYSIPSLLDTLSLSSSDDERAVEAALFALFAFTEGPQPRAPSGSAAAGGGGAGKITMTVKRTGSGAGGGSDVSGGGDLTIDVSPSVLWTGARESVAKTAVDYNNITVADTFYLRVRCAWLGGHGGLGAGANGLTSSVPANVREVALEEALPSLHNWTALLTTVLHAAGVDVGGSNNGSSASSSGDASSSEGLSHLAPSAAALAKLRSLPPVMDEAIPMARQLLLLGQLLDFSDESSRRGAAAVLAAALPHPALPLELLPLVAHALASAAGCGSGAVEAAGRSAAAPVPAASPSSPFPDPEAEAAAAASNRAAALTYRGYVDLLGRTIGALTSAAHACLSSQKAGGGDDGSAGAGSGKSGKGGLAALRARSEALRQQLEDAEDAGTGDDVISELTSELAAAEDALADAEAGAAMGGGDDDEDDVSGGDGVMMAHEGGRVLTSGQLGVALSSRAVELSRVLLAGAPVGLQSVHQSVVVPVLTSALRESLGPAVTRAAAASLASDASAAGDASDAGAGFDAVLAESLVDDHPLLATVLLPALSSSSRARLVAAAAGGDADDEELTSAQAEVDALTSGAATTLAGYILCQPRESAAARLARVHTPRLTILLTSSLSAASPRVAAAAVEALCDVAAVLGTGCISLTSLPVLLTSLIQPEGLLAATLPQAHQSAASSSSAVAFVVQSAAARGLLKLVLCGAIPCALPLSSAPWTASALMAPSSLSQAFPSNSSSSNGGGVAAGAAALATSWPLAGALTSLQCLYWAAVWAAAVGSPLSINGSASAVAAAADDQEAPVGGIGDGRTQETAFALSSLLHTLSVGFQTVARTSHGHKAALLTSCVTALRWMLPLSRLLKVSGPVAGLGPTSGDEEGGGAAASGGRGGRKAAASKAAKGKKKPAAKGRKRSAKDDDDDEGDDDDEDSDVALFSDDDDADDAATTVAGSSGAGAAPPGTGSGARPPRAPAPLRSGATSAAVGPSSSAGVGPGSKSVVSVSSSMSALASGGGGGSAVGAGGRWVAMALSYSAAMAAIEPVTTAAAAAPAAVSPLVAALAAACPQLAPLLTSSDGEPAVAALTSSSTASHAALAAHWLVEAAADAAVFGPSPAGSLLAVFVPALSSLPPPSLFTEGDDEPGAAAAAVNAVFAALMQDLLKGVVTGARSASGEKALRKLAGPGKWELPIDAKAGTAPSTDAAGAAIAACKTAVHGRCDSLKTAAVACGAIVSSASSSSAGTRSRAASGATAAATAAVAGSAAVGPRASTSRSRTASAASPSASSVGSAAGRR